MNEVGGALVTVIVYGTVAEATFSNGVILTESNVEILTESGQDLLVETP